MDIRVEALREPTDEAEEAFAHLLPQLSSSARPFSRAGLTEVLTCPANTVLVARADGRMVGTLTLGALIDTLPQGLDTTVGDRGFRLSGGERQRLSLARLFLADPNIVILDEATAHLDTLTEAALHDAMTHHLAGRTMLIIAHRQTTIENADRTIRLDHGRVIAIDHAGTAS